MIFLTILAASLPLFFSPYSSKNRKPSGISWHGTSSALLMRTSPLCSHFVHELMSFDNDLRETWNYMPDPYSQEDWRGLAWEVLSKEGWFDRWLQVEKNFALARYKEIVDTPDSGHIDYEGVDPSATKPTRAAIRVNDLLETITERYQPLSSFSQKLRFLIDIQITIFDQFHERLHSALEAYLAMTSTIGRTVQGADGQASVEGIAGLERLCRVFGSAEYLEKKMEDWRNGSGRTETGAGMSPVLCRLPT
jgi:hypothetical protein